MTPLVNLSNGILLELPNCAQPLAVKSYRDAAITFCKRSEAYRSVLKNLTVVKDIADYQLPVPDETRLVKIQWVKVDGKAIDATSPKQATDEPRSIGEALRYYQNGLTGISFDPAPSKTLPIEFSTEVALTPTQVATQLDDELVERYQDTILHGALYILYRNPGMPWHDLKVSNDHLQHFQLGIEEAKSEANRDNTNRPKVMAYGGI